MRRSLAALAATVVAIAALGAATASAAPAGWTLNVVHGISLPVAANVSVCAKPSSTSTWQKIAGPFNFKDVKTVPGLTGKWDAKVVAGADCTAGALAGLQLSNVEFPDGTNVSVVAYEKVGGGVALGAQVNNVAPTAGNLARVSVYHYADAPAVDVRAGLILWIPVLFSNVSQGGAGNREVPAATYTVAITPAGGGIFRVVKLARLGLPSDTNTIVYAVGSLQAGTFSLVTQQISVG